LLNQAQGALKTDGGENVRKPKVHLELFRPEEKRIHPQRKVQQGGVVRHCALKAGADQGRRKNGGSQVSGLIGEYNQVGGSMWKVALCACVAEPEAEGEDSEIRSLALAREAFSRALV